MESATPNTDDRWRRIRVRHRLMTGLWFGAGPFLALDLFAVPHALGVSTAFFLMLGYLCTFIVVTVMYTFNPCPVCGDPIRYQAGSRGSSTRSIECIHCGATPLGSRP